jgi:GDPmannose 4,6-dehydratase
MYGVSTCPSTGYTEESKMLPASPYACAKLFAHNITRNYRESYALHASCGILFNHESARRGETFVTRKISMAAARIKTGVQETLCLGNLNAYRDWGYAPDYVEGMWRMLQQDKPDDYVLSTGETHTVEEYLNETFKLAGLSVHDHVKFDARLCRPEEVPYLLGNHSKAKEKLGWEPKTKFTDLVRLMYDNEIDNLVR